MFGILARFAGSWPDSGEEVQSAISLKDNNYPRARDGYRKRIKKKAKREISPVDGADSRWIFVLGIFNKCCQQVDTANASDNSNSTTTNTRKSTTTKSSSSFIADTLQFKIHFSFHGFFLLCFRIWCVPSPVESNSECNLTVFVRCIFTRSPNGNGDREGEKSNTSTERAAEAE